MGYLDNDLYGQLPGVANLQVNSGADLLHREVGYTAVKEITITGTGGAASINCFTVTGTVGILALYGIFSNVTEVTAITVASWEFYSATAAAVPITAAAGTTLSGAALNSCIAKVAGVATALTFNNATQVRVAENAGGNHPFFNCLLTADNAATSLIRFLVTTDANTNAKIKMYCSWVGRGATGIGTVTPA